MPEPSNKIKIIFILDVFLFLICGLGIYHVSQKAGFEPTTHVNFEVSGEKVVVQNVYDGSLKKHLSRGDVINSIDGFTICCKEDIEFINDSKAIDQIISISLLRNNEIIESNIILPQFYSLFYIIVQIIVGSVFFVLGVFVLYKRPTEKVALIWHWATVCTAIIIMCTWGRFTIQPEGTGLLIRVAFSIAYAFVSTLYLHLTFIFPRNKFKYLNKLIYPLYIFSFMLAVWMSVAFFFAAMQLSSEWFHIFMKSFDLVRIYFTIVIFFGMGNFIHSYITAREESERRKIRWVILGLAIGPPAFVIFWQIPQLFAFDALIPEEIIVMFMLIIPITFSISIVKYNIFNIDLILQRGTVYFLVVALLIFVYAVVVGLSMLFIGSITIQTSLIASVATAVLIPFLFEPIRKSMQRLVDKKFFHVGYNYRLVQRNFTNELNQCLDIKQLAKLLTDELDKLLHTECSAFVLKNTKTKKWEILAGKTCEHIPFKLLQNIHKILETTDKKIIAKEEVVEAGIEISTLTDNSVIEAGICIIIPFKNQSNEIIGMQVLGRKKSELRFSMEDCDLLTTVAAQAGLDIERISLNQELILKNVETQRLEELNQLMSFFVSSVSHDLQTPLTSIKMFAELLKSREQLSQTEKEEYLEIIEGESERLSRLINNVLDFSKIERGIKQYKFLRLNIVEIIELTLRLMKYQLKQHDFQVETVFGKRTIMVIADKDAIISAILNLISNAIKYSDREKYLKIEILTENSWAKINIFDKGMGISDEDQKYIFETFYRSKNEQIQSSGGAGLGLTIVWHIIEAHKGKVEVQSTPGKGSIFSLYLPLEK